MLVHQTEIPRIDKFGIAPKGNVQILALEIIIAAHVLFKVRITEPAHNAGRVRVDRQDIIWGDPVPQALDIRSVRRHDRAIETIQLT